MPHPRPHLEAPPASWREVQETVRDLPSDDLAHEWQSLIADTWLTHGEPSLPIALDVLGVVHCRLIRECDPPPMPRHSAEARLTHTRRGIQAVH